MFMQDTRVEYEEVFFNSCLILSNVINMVTQQTNMTIGFIVKAMW